MENKEQNNDNNKNKLSFPLHYNFYNCNFYLDCCYIYCLDLIEKEILQR